MNASMRSIRLYFIARVTAAAAVLAFLACASSAWGEQNPNFRPQPGEMTVPTFPGAPKRVEAANAYPLSAVVHLEITFPDGFVASGSGAVVERFHVLSAGHVVYQSHHGGFAKDVDVYAGQTGSTYPFAVAHGQYFRTFDSFIADDQASQAGEHQPGDGDIGMIFLDRPLGDETGTFGYGYNDDNDFNGWVPGQAGYPGESPFSGNDMYFEHGPILGTHAGTNSSFGYFDWDQKTMTTVGGQSGSGLFDGGDKNIYGVVEAKSTGQGYAERITKDVYDSLQNWIAADEEVAP
jgi:V8-like Glu-specific endopeptidase